MMSPFPRLILMVSCSGMVASCSLDDAESITSEPEARSSQVMEVHGVATKVDTQAVMLDGPSIITLETSNGPVVIEVPSMGLPLCAAAASIADPFIVDQGDQVRVRGARVAQGRLLPCEDAMHYLEVTGFAGDAYGIRIPYRKGPDGYVALEQADGNGARRSMHLVLRSEHERWVADVQAGVVREAPPAIQLQVLDNPRRMWSGQWAEAHPEISGVDRAITPAEDVVVGGANAVRLVADGLYPEVVYVVAHGQSMYLLSGARPSPESTIYRDFEAMVERVVFVPTAEQAGE